MARLAHLEAVAKTPFTPGVHDFEVDNAALNLNELLSECCYDTRIPAGPRRSNLHVCRRACTVERRRTFTECFMLLMTALRVCPRSMRNRACGLPDELYALCFVPRAHCLALSHGVSLFRVSFGSNNLT